MYAAVRSSAPCWRGILVVRGDRTPPRVVHPCRWREDEATVVRLYEVYREAWRPLQQAIKGMKRWAWGELLLSLDSDPWGYPYKMVLNKLRPWAFLATESMDSWFLEEAVGTLFSGATGEEDSRFTDERWSEEEPRDTAGSWSPESRINEEELAEAVGRIGVPAYLWKVVVVV